jgi:putative DNA primase/helicase
VNGCQNKAGKIDQDVPDRSCKRSEATVLEDRRLSVNVTPIAIEDHMMNLTNFDPNDHIDGEDAVSGTAFLLSPERAEEAAGDLPDSLGHEHHLTTHPDADLENATSFCRAESDSDKQQSVDDSGTDRSSENCTGGVGVVLSGSAFADPVDVLDDSGTETASNSTPSLEAVDDPHRLAQTLIDQRFTLDGNLILRRWHCGWCRWDGARYVRCDDAELRAHITQHAKREFDLEIQQQQVTGTTKPSEKLASTRKVTKSLVSNVVQALESLTHLSGNVCQPCWLGDGEPPIDPQFTFPTSSCLLDLDALIRGKALHVPPTPLFFSSRAVSYEFDPDADCPEWIQFLWAIWPTDTGSVELLQEFCGYCLTNDTSQHKMLMMVGPPRSGKGTIGRILKELIGPLNVASPTLGSLSGSFGLWPLHGKSLAIVPDARLSGRADAVAVVERLLSIVGEDPQDIDRKCISPLTAVHMPLRFVLMANEIPTLADASGAIVTRTMLLRMTRSFVGCEDRHLQDRLIPELPGILNWAIAGWQRLKSRGHFLQPESGQELLGDMKRQASPISEFLEDCCEIGPAHSISVKDIFGAWKHWCEEHGRDRTSTEATFGKNLRAAVPSLGDTRPRIGLVRQRVYTGIGLKAGVASQLQASNQF